MYSETEQSGGVTISKVLNRSICTVNTSKVDLWFFTSAKMIRHNFYSSISSSRTDWFVTVRQLLHSKALHNQFVDHPELSQMLRYKTHPAASVHEQNHVFTRAVHE